MTPIISQIVVIIAFVAVVVFVMWSKLFFSTILMLSTFPKRQIKMHTRTMQ